MSAFNGIGSGWDEEWAETYPASKEVRHVQRRNRLLKVEINLTETEIRKIIEGLEEREMWGSGYKLANRFRYILRRNGIKADA